MFFSVCSVCDSTSVPAKAFVDGSRPAWPDTSTGVSVLEVVPAERLRETALAVAAEIAAKDPTVIRAAKESLNGIDLWDVKNSYRYEQGFTFELNLSGVADRVREDFGSDANGKDKG